MGDNMKGTGVTSQHDPAKLARFSPQGSVWIYPLLRASIDRRSPFDNLMVFVRAIDEHER